MMETRKIISESKIAEHVPDVDMITDFFDETGNDCYQPFRMWTPEEYSQYCDDDMLEKYIAVHDYLKSEGAEDGETILVYISY